MMKKTKIVNIKDKKLKIAMIGHKRIPSREGGVEIVVEEISTRLVNLGMMLQLIIEKVIMSVEKNLMTTKR